LGYGLEVGWIHLRPFRKPERPGSQEVSGPPQSFSCHAPSMSAAAIKPDVSEKTDGREYDEPGGAEHAPVPPNGPGVAHK
jgi:hypothetical protein